MDECAHENVALIGDMPLADPESFEFLGRFDVMQCSDCLETLSKTPTVYPESQENYQNI